MATSAATVVQDRHVRKARSLHLIDIENLAGSPFASAGEVRHVVDRYRVVVGVGPADLAVVGCNPALAYEAHDAWPSARLRWGSGKDGADLALLDGFCADAVARRFVRVVIASGDHIFSAAAWQARWAGLVVAVAVGRGALAASLRLAASTVLDLGLDAPTPARAA